MTPLKCWSCGKAVHEEIVKFKALVQSGMKPNEALDQLKLRRVCCRRFPIIALQEAHLLHQHVTKTDEHR
mgnify:CR=1 FL=1